MGTVVNLDTVAVAATIASIVMLLRRDAMSACATAGLSLICSSISMLRRVRRAFDRPE